MSTRPAALCCTLILMMAAVPACLAQEPDPAVVAHVEALPPLPANASAEQLEQRGDELRARKQALEAIDAYAAALKLAPGRASLFNKAGIANLQIQRYGVAKHCFELAIKA